MLSQVFGTPHLVQKLPNWVKPVETVFQQPDPYPGPETGSLIRGLFHDRSRALSIKIRMQSPRSHEK